MKGHTYSKRNQFPREFTTDRVYPDFGGAEQATANAANETIALANATRACRGDTIILGSHVSARMRGGARRAALLFVQSPAASFGTAVRKLGGRSGLAP